MAEHFNCHRLPAWSSLTDSERSWAGYLGRWADDHDIVREWYYGAHTLLEPYELDEPARLVAWLVDSILTALTHQEVRIAFRAFVQATEYLTRLQGQPVERYWPGSSFLDAYRTAQCRLEAELFRGQTDRVKFSRMAAQ